MSKENQTEWTRRDRLLGRVPAPYQAGYLAAKRKTNSNRTFGFSIYIIVIQIVLNLLNMLKPDTGETGSVAKYVVLSLLTMFVGVAFLTISILIKKRLITSTRFINNVPYTLLYLYVVIQLVFLFFNLQNDAGFNSYIIAIIITSFFIVTSPLESTLIISGAFIIAILLATFAAEGQMDIILATDTWANVLIITVLCAYMSIVLHNMYIRNYLASVELAESNEKLHRAAQTDALTGVYNRRGFFDFLAETYDGRELADKYLVLAMCDVDYFKRYNDRNGHLEGDACLMKVAQTLKTCLAESGGQIGRYGGEEFLGVYEADSPRRALAVAEKCRAMIEARNMSGQHEPGEAAAPITISIGVAYTKSRGVIDIEAMIKRADAALYEAKEGGRNQVKLSLSE